MSEMTFPPAGTKCRDCGCCEATVYAGNDPICWDCDAGNPCPGRKRAKTAEAHARPVDLPPIRLEPVSQSNEVLEEKRVNTTGKSGTRIPAEIRDKMLAEPLDMSNRAVGEKYGVREGSVWYIRNKAGMHSTAVRKPGTAVIEKKHSKVCAPKRAVQPVLSEARLERAMTATPAIDQRKIAVTVQIDEVSADAFWHGLTLEQKAASIELQMQAIIDQRVAARV